MVGFQNQVNITKAYGVRGEFADGNYNHMYALTLLAEANPTVKIEVGKFAWDKGDGTASAVGTGKPTGIVHRTMSLPLVDITEGATMIIPERYPVPIMDKGSMFIEISTPATVNQKVFVNNTTGVITSNTAGASVDGSTETDFRIISLCENTSGNNQLVIVTNVY